MQLIFRDFKTSNVLLDEDFNAKLSDFGLARQGPSEGLSHVSTSVSCWMCIFNGLNGLSFYCHWNIYLLQSWFLQKFGAYADLLIITLSVKAILLNQVSVLSDRI